jgi:uncharacterized protein YgbK (DUF1537 family)
MSADTAFFILTNTRSMEAGDAVKINIEIAALIKKITERLEINFIIISRSDSTLRGHFPGELLALQKGLQSDEYAFVLFPFFEEGGRITMNDIHYLQQGEMLIPVAETAFAKDHSFGYTQSNLKQYIIEKTGNEIAEKDIISISLEDLRSDNSATIVSEKIMSLQPGQYCVVNAIEFYDATVFALAVLQITKRQNILFRTAASFVQAVCGISRQPLFKNIREPNNPNGGLIIVGSYVPLTTEQVEATMAEGKAATIEIDVQDILNQSTENLLQAKAKQMNDLLWQKKDVMIFTSRRLITANHSNSSLSIGNKVSAFLVKLVQQLNTRPSYIIAKGGITSSDIATKCLYVKRAIIRGQAIAGVPVWQLGTESRFPGLHYIVFPGNVGNRNSLRDLVSELRDQQLF